MKCPDPQILSIYLDGELPSPWKEKVEAHFTQCPKCSTKLENYKRLQYLFRKEKSIKRVYVERTTDPVQSVESGKYMEHTGEEDDDDMSKAKARIWNKIEGRYRFSPRYRQRSALWQRRLSIPLPAAAAAVVVLISAVFWIHTSDNAGIAGRHTEAAAEVQVGRTGSDFILASEMERIEEIQVSPAASMSGVLQYFSSSGTNIIILQLPETKSFSRTGEPAIIRAADFRRR